MSYAVTKNRVVQWLGIILIIGVFAGAYWYFKVYGSTLNQSQNDLNTNGLVGLWSFNGDDMNGTTAYDRSSTGANGTLTSGPTIVKGKVGQAINLDGSDDRVNMGNFLDFERTAPFTISVWLKLPSATPSTVDYIVTKVDGSAIGYAIAIRGDVANDPLELELRGSSTYISLRSDQVWVANQWTHVVWTYDGSITAAGMKLYRDGVLQRTTTQDASLTTQTISNSGNFLVGALIASSSPFLGAIDEVRVYNRAVSASEIQSLYTQGGGTELNTSVSQPQGTGRLDSGLAGYWALDDGTSGATPTTATDSSTNGNTGTLTTGPTWTTGQIGNAVDLDGTDDYISIGRSAITSTNALTLSVWAKFGSSRDGVGHPLFGNVNGQSGSDGQSLYVDNSGTYNIVGFAGGSFVATTIIPSLDTWYHFVDTFDGVTERIYINGALAYSGAGTVTQAAENNVHLGSHVGSSSTTYMDGAVDEARVYTRALSPEEVAWLYGLTAPTPVDTSLKGYWSFNGQDMLSSTTAADRSGAGNTGTLTNGPTRTIGKLGQALSFDGSDDYVTMADASSLDITGAISMAIWVKTTDTSGCIMTKGTGTSDKCFDLSANKVYELGILSSVLYFQTSNGTTTNVASVSASSILDNQWHLLGATWDGTTGTNGMKIYIDGTLSAQATATVTPAQTTASTFNFGGNGNNNDYAGLLDEARVYNRALSVEEIKGLYDVGQSDKTNSSISQPQGTGRLDSGLAGYWKLDDGSGTSATDSSTNASTGTLTSGPTWTTGQIGGAVNFDGTDDYITAGDQATLETNNSLAIGGWFKLDTLPSGNRMFLVTKGGTTSYYEYELNVNGANSNKIRFTLGAIGGGAYLSTDSITAPTTGTWFHVMGVFDKSTLSVKVYYNGVLEGTSTSTSGTLESTKNSNFNIGKRDDSAETELDGLADEVRVYDRTLSADEVAQLYRLNAPMGTDTSMKGYWSFNGSDMLSSTAAADRSGAGNTGTLTGNAARAIGKIGQGITFDGSGDYVDVGDMASIEGQSQVSFAAWVKPRTLVDFAGIFGKQFSDSGNDLSVIAGGGAIPNTSVIFIIRNGSNDYGYTGSGKLAAGTWTHVVGTFDGSQSGNANRMKIYINGVSETLTFSGTIPATTPSSTTPMTIGKISTFYFDGFIDEARIYNRALSAGEAASLYNQGR